MKSSCGKGSGCAAAFKRLRVFICKRFFDAKSKAEEKWLEKTYEPLNYGQLINQYVGYLTK